MSEPVFSRLTVAELCSLKNGYGFEPKDWSGYGLPIIRIQNLNGGSDFNYYAGPPPPDYIIDPGDLLFAWSGNRGTSFGPFIWRGPRGLLNQHIFKVTPNPGVPQAWLYHALQIARESAERQAHGGSGLVHVKRGDLLSFEIPTPPPYQREKLAEILDVVDQAIEQTESLIAKYQRIKTGLMHDLLTRGIDEHGRLRDPATHRFKDSPLGLVPEDWEVNPLRHYLKFISYGFTNPMPEAPEGPFLVTAANVVAGAIDYGSCRHTTQDAFDRLLTNKSRPVKNDILLTKDGTLGRLALVDDVVVCINQSVAVLRVNEEVEASFLKAILEAPLYQDLLIADAGGSTIKHLYISRIGEMPVVVPSQLEERQVILGLIRVQTKLLQTYSQELHKLHRLKTGLMQDLLTGKVSIEPLLSSVISC
jgi:type I restriction enzyme, S subunit